MSFVDRVRFVRCSFIFVAGDLGTDLATGDWVEGLGGKRKAACWRYYKVRVSPDQPDKVTAVCCKSCGPELSPTWSGNTSNLRSHLAHIHKDLYCKMIEAEGDSVLVARPTDVSTCSTTPSPKAGALEAILPPVSKERRDELHKKVCPRLNFFFLTTRVGGCYGRIRGIR